MTLTDQPIVLRLNGGERRVISRCHVLAHDTGVMKRHNQQRLTRLVAAAMVVAPLLAGPRCCCGGNCRGSADSPVNAESSAVCSAPVSDDCCCDRGRTTSSESRDSDGCQLRGDSGSCSGCRTCRDEGCRCGKQESTSLQPPNSVELRPASALGWHSPLVGLSLVDAPILAAHLPTAALGGNARQALLCVWRN